MKTRPTIQNLKKILSQKTASVWISSPRSANSIKKIHDAISLYSKEKNKKVYTHNINIQYLTYQTTNPLLYLEDQFTSLSKKEKNIIVISHLEYLSEKDINTLIKLRKKYADRIKTIFFYSTVHLTKRSDIKLEQHAYIFNDSLLTFREILSEQYNVKNLKRTASLKKLQAFKQTQTNLSQLFTQYAIWGGQKDVFFEKNELSRTQLLEEYFTQYIQDDISHLLERRKYIRQYVHFLHYLTKHTLQPLKNREAATVLDLHQPLLEKFIDLSEKSFFAFYVDPFYTDPQTEHSKRTQVTILDHSLFHVKKIDSTDSYLELFSSERLIKNALIADLIKRNSIRVKYYRTITKLSIDIVLEEGSSICPIMFALDGNKKRALKNIAKFSKIYKKRMKKPILITQNTLEKTDTHLSIPMDLFPLYDVNAHMSA